MIALPKSTNSGRIAGNLDLFHFELTESEMERLCSLDIGKGSHNPETLGKAEWMMENYKVHDWSLSGKE